MKKLLFALTFCLIMLALHCYALHKRIAYMRGEVARSIIQQRAIQQTLADVIEEYTKKEGVK